MVRNTGAPESWDPHVGLKPSPQDDCASDADIKMEEDLPYGAVIEVSDVMVNMMVDLGDTHDLEWLPLTEQRKLAARKTGLISSALRLKYQDNSPVCREKKGPLSWP
jgi:hypothetical protein